MNFLRCLADLVARCSCPLRRPAPTAPLGAACRRLRLNENSRLFVCAGLLQQQPLPPPKRRRPPSRSPGATRWRSLRCARPLRPRSSRTALGSCERALTLTAGEKTSTSRRRRADSRRAGGVVVARAATPQAGSPPSRRWAAGRFSHLPPEPVVPFAQPPLTALPPAAARSAPRMTPPRATTRTAALPSSSTPVTTKARVARSVLPPCLTER